jgi:tetratricopeptide (TPR) repeat protein
MPLKTLRLLALAGSLIAPLAFADDYADVSQLLRSNKFSEALSKADAYLASKPADPQMRFLKGVVQRNLGKNSEAIATFTRLTEDYPELPEPYNNLAVLYAAQGQYDKSRMALEMAIRTNPSYSTAHENLGDVYARLASQAYNKALQLDSANVAVPPKLALIRELFKPNLGGPRPAGASSVAPASAAPTASAEAHAPEGKPAAPANPVAASSSAPAATKPVPAAPVATPVAPSATVATAPAKPTVGAPDKAGVEAAVLAWAQAWSAKDMAGYLSAYSADFDTPGNQPRAAWEKDRTDRIVGKSSIAVKITELAVSLQGNEAMAHFRQAYRANSLSVSSRKTLHLRFEGGRWLITKESTGR